MAYVGETEENDEFIDGLQQETSSSLESSSPTENTDYSVIATEGEPNDIVVIEDGEQIQTLIQEAGNLVRDVAIILNKEFTKANNILSKPQNDVENEISISPLEIPTKELTQTMSIPEEQDPEKKKSTETLKLGPEYGKYTQIDNQGADEKDQVNSQMLEGFHLNKSAIVEKRADSPSTTEHEVLKQVAIQGSTHTVDNQDFGHELVQKLRVIQSKATKQKLITRSHYNGVWQDALQCMDGYGIYTYPDGSEYRGYFSRGNFNGYGALHLAAPYNFTFKGTFIDGLLHEIEDMWFHDGLHVNGSFHGWSADFSQWKYCCPSDRRYAPEQLEGLPAVGPYSFLTSKRPPRELHKNYFDLEEGIYNPSSGVIINRPKPFTKMTVPCKDHIDWIEKNCRHCSEKNMTVSAEVSQQIIRNNLESEMELAEHEPSCNYDQANYRKRYFAKLCKESYTNKLYSGAEFNESEDSIGCRLPDSSVSSSSFSDRSLSIDVQEYLEASRQYGNMKLGRDLEREAPGLMSEPFKRDSTRNSTSYYRKSK